MRARETAAFAGGTVAADPDASRRNRIAQPAHRTLQRVQPAGGARDPAGPGSGVATTPPRAWRGAQAPAGRAERFGGARGLPLVVVDYAHTPDALEKILTALREHTRGKLCCVFGCGGDRDRGKRPVMGGIAERLADMVLLTDDNPRHESGDAIIADIVGGMRAAPRIIRDRRNAIADGDRGRHGRRHRAHRRQGARGLPAGGR